MMRRQWIQVLLGFWIAVVPFLGFPGAWKNFFIVISALAVAGLSLAFIFKKHTARLVPDSLAKDTEDIHQ